MYVVVYLCIAGYFHIDLGKFKSENFLQHADNEEFGCFCLCVNVWFWNGRFGLKDGLIRWMSSGPWKPQAGF